MPYADPTARRLADRDRKRRSRAKAAQAKLAATPEATAVTASNPAAAVALWSKSSLVVPHGHPLAGSPTWEGDDTHE